jgi:subtilisin family serine protease
MLDKATQPGKTPVTVAILDTIPNAHALSTAVHDFPQNTLLQTLIAKAPEGFRLTYMPLNLLQDTLHPQHGVHVANAHHGFSDHGLFVAGIVQTLAPGANLHLIQVLNDYAAGTLESLVWGFAEALRTAPPEAPLLINCSLTINIPNSPDYLKGAQVEDELVRFFEEINESDPNFVRWLSRTAQQAVAAITTHQQGAVIAAAGNEGDTTTARYPGAYDEVYGVGALNHDLSRAGYSNVADSPIGQGFVTYGGNTDPNTGSAHATTGMLGLYIGTFPDGTPSQNGWGRWAGTSFAAPVVTGLAAGLCSHGLTPDEAQQEIRNMLSGDMPDVLPLTQHA